jgi:chromosome segregation ATPase
VTEPADLEAAEKTIRETCASMLARASQERKFTRPHSGASPGEVHEAMLEVRTRLDSLEEMRATLLGLAAGARAEVRQAEAEVQDAWDKLADSQDGRQSISGEFLGKEERYARWNIRVLPLRRELRRLQRVADLVAATEAQVSTYYFGLRDLQGELKATMRYLEFESVLERL